MCRSPGQGCGAGTADVDVLVGAGVRELADVVEVEFIAGDGAAVGLSGPGPGWQDRVQELQQSDIGGARPGEDLHADAGEVDREIRNVAVR